MDRRQCPQTDRATGLNEVDKMICHDGRGPMRKLHRSTLIGWIFDRSHTTRMKRVKSPKTTRPRGMGFDRTDESAHRQSSGYE